MTKVVKVVPIVVVIVTNLIKMQMTVHHNPKIRLQRLIQPRQQLQRQRLLLQQQLQTLPQLQLHLYILPQNTKLILVLAQLPRQILVLRQSVRLSILLSLMEIRKMLQHLPLALPRIRRGQLHPVTPMSFVQILALLFPINTHQPELHSTHSQNVT